LKIKADSYVRYNLVSILPTGAFKPNPAKLRPFPTESIRMEYVVKIDNGMPLSPRLVGMLVRVQAHSMEVDR